MLSPQELFERGCNYRRSFEHLAPKSSCFKLSNQNEEVRLAAAESEDLGASGPKFNLSTGSADEKQQIKAARQQLYSAVSDRRIRRLGTMMMASYCPTSHTVCLEKINSSLAKCMGYTANRGLRYLYPEEALYLVDMGCLQLFFCGVMLSLPHAMELLIPASSLHEYFVYCSLMRAGYLVVKHDSSRIYEADNDANTVLDKRQRSESDSLKDYDGHNSLSNPPPLKQARVAAFTEDDSLDSAALSVKVPDESSCSIIRNEKHMLVLPDEPVVPLASACLDDPDKIWSQLQIIKLIDDNDDKSDSDDASPESSRSSCKIKVSYDLYVHNRQHFKLSQLSPPDYYLCIVKHTDAVPSVAELQKISRTLRSKAKMLVAVVCGASISYFAYDSSVVPPLCSVVNIHKLSNRITIQ